MLLVLAILLFAIALLCLFFPQLINVLSEQQKRRMDRRKVGVTACIGLMIPAVILLVFHFSGIEGELIPMFVVIPCAIGTAIAIQIVAK